MEKITSDFVKVQYLSEDVAAYYAESVKKIGLWESEKIIFGKYLNKSDYILDVGCGTGRTTIGLKKLGFENIIGIDLSEVMIAVADKLSADTGLNISFKTGDATNLNFTDGTFDKAIFSYNGIMQIPGASNRMKALKDINRVLKKGGLFIFTTHDRYGKISELKEYWDIQKDQWEKGERDNRLHDFGDILFYKHGLECYSHIPDKAEVEAAIKDAGFKLAERSYRSDICGERPELLEYSLDCIFWVVEKK